MKYKRDKYLREILRIVYLRRQIRDHQYGTAIYQLIFLKNYKHYLENYNDNA